MDKEFFRWWHGGSSPLRTFWVKAVEELTEVEPPEGCSWSLRSRPREGIIAHCPEPKEYIITTCGSCEGERRSIIIVWDLESAEFLEDNPDVIVELSEPVPEIMETGWRYYIHPRRETTCSSPTQGRRL